VAKINCSRNIFSEQKERALSDFAAARKISFSIRWHTAFGAVAFIRYNKMRKL
jgi:hypothetical protein